MLDVGGRMKTYTGDLIESLVALVDRVTFAPTTSIYYESRDEYLASLTEHDPFVEYQARTRRNWPCWAER